MDVPIGLKIAIIGDGQVGKTCLRESFTGIAFEASPIMIKTLGADFSKKTIMIDSKQVELQIWDLAGQPGWIMVREAFYAGIMGAIVVFDYSRNETIASIPHWVRELWTHNNIGHVPLVITGNKSDLKARALEKGTGIPDAAVQKMLAELRSGSEGIPIDFFDTSAKNGYNVDKAFYKLGKNTLEFVMKLQQAIDEE
ncbi:MAG: GTP-binding protein [Candidatus Odinarchaeota archaeon]